MVWWKKSYINRRDWILENQGSLKLSPQSLMITLMIDFMNENNESISLETLAKRSGLEIEEVDTTIQNLINSMILQVSVMNQSIEFNLDNLFKNGVIYEHVDEDIFGVFETEFGRLLTQAELQTLNTWLRRYTEEEILDALRSAMMYKKMSMQYINAILVNKTEEKRV
ncbi:DnaD domain-containing protein [Erysipelothrix sp. HDW6A]|uniref:DnaD domain-containing protein n=1 Tax=Erysipelothrix sp. HDW6A TaxID=2714928 RepID=UPI001F0FB1B1|nr:DnaD domain protein [Erysipelothrix sp. HDW6A]